MNLTMSLTTRAVKITTKILMDSLEGLPVSHCHQWLSLYARAIIIFVRVFIVLVVKLIIKFYCQMILRKLFFTYVYVDEFFTAKIDLFRHRLQRSEYKSLSITIAFSFRLLRLSLLSLFFLSFSFLSVILDLWDAWNLPFGLFSDKWLHVCLVR